MSNQSVLWAEDSGVVRLVLNRPERLNALSAEMHQELADAMDRIEALPAARLLILTGAGRAFCAGQDLSERDFSKGRPDLGESTGRWYNPLIRRLTNLQVPVVAAVNGVAAGAGVSIALACDIVIAKRSAKFVQAFSSIGLIPDAGGTWFLPRAIGLPRALGTVLLGKSITSEQAASWGMIWEAVDDGDFDTRIEEIAGLLGSAPTRGLANAKKALRQSTVSGLDEQLELERNLQRECGLTSDYQEGVEAFKMKRRPFFKGR